MRPKLFLCAGLASSFMLVAGCAFKEPEADCRSGQFVVFEAGEWQCFDEADFGEPTEPCSGENRILIRSGDLWTCIEEPVDVLEPFESTVSLDPIDKRAVRAMIEIVFQGADPAGLVAEMSEQSGLLSSALVQLPDAPAALYIVKWGAAMGLFFDAPTCTQHLLTQTQSLLTAFQRSPSGASAMQAQFGVQGLDTITMSDLRSLARFACQVSCRDMTDCLSLKDFVDAKEAESCDAGNC